MFTMFCEENLSIKPVLADTGCQRLSKCTDQRPRKLLIYLRSESSASRNLQRNEATRGFYIFNPDLSPVESKLAFEQRQRRRLTRRSSLNADSAEFHPANVTASGISASADVCTSVNANANSDIL